MILRHRFLLTLSSFAFLSAAASGAHAQALGRMLACQEVPQAEARLACYDSAARAALGLGAAPAQSAEAEIARRAAELDAREAKLAAREAQLQKAAAVAKPGKPSPVAVAAAPSMDPAMAEREAALKVREAELSEREAKLAALPAAKAEESATLFGIPIPFTRKDSFNQQTDADGVVIERDSDGDVDAIKAPVREWSLTGEGLLIVVLENGQVWRQTEGEPLKLRSGEGNTNVARISRGAIGSFMMTVNESSKSVKVRRVDGKKPKS
jgi:hypothetical protein